MFNCENELWGILFEYRADGSLFNLSRFRTRNKTTDFIISEIQYADDNGTPSDSPQKLQNLTNASVKFSGYLWTRQVRSLGSGSTATTPPPSPAQAATGQSLNSFDLSALGLTPNSWNAITRLSLSSFVKSAILWRDNLMKPKSLRDFTPIPKRNWQTIIQEVSKQR